MVQRHGGRIVPILPVGSEPGLVPRDAEPHTRGESSGLTTLPPLSLYIHLPWCLRKCPYCDFNSHEHRPDGPQQARYRQALIHDLEAALPQIWGRPVHSVFIGGGTPSLFEPEEIERLLGDVRARVRLEPGCEITMEANPGTFERERFRAYAQAGVTRLSIGVQSFDDQALRELGRVHDGQQAREAVQEAAQCFETWNLDLMYALPGQDLAGLERDLRMALSFSPPHLSIYHLTLEPNTRFALEPPPGLPQDDEAFEMLDRIVELTAEAGLQRYEVSAFARRGAEQDFRCVHNLNYWRFGDYLGIGAGAHSKLSFPDRLERQVRWREPQTYLRQVEQGQAVSNVHPIEPRDRPFEFMLNGLRLLQGVSWTRYAERTGLPPAALRKVVDEAVGRGLLQRTPEGVSPTARGLDFLSDLQAMFLPP